MLFEKGEATKHKITFEVSKETQFQERVVAMNALGIAVVNRCNNTYAHMPFAQLGVVLMQLKGTQDVDGKTEPVATSTELSIEEATLLDTALSEFVKDTPDAIRSALLGGPSNCLTRAVEGGMAQLMQEQLQRNFNIEPVALTVKHTGFSPPNLA